MRAFAALVSGFISLFLTDISEVTRAEHNPLFYNVNVTRQNQKVTRAVSLMKH